MAEKSGPGDFFGAKPLFTEQQKHLFSFMKWLLLVTCELALLSNWSLWLRDYDIEYLRLGILLLGSAGAWLFLWKVVKFLVRKTNNVSYFVWACIGTLVTYQMIPGAMPMIGGLGYTTGVLFFFKKWLERTSIREVTKWKLFYFSIMLLFAVWLFLISGPIMEGLPEAYLELSNRVYEVFIPLNILILCFIMTSVRSAIKNRLPIRLLVGLYAFAFAPIFPIAHQAAVLDAAKVISPLAMIAAAFFEYPHTRDREKGFFGYLAAFTLLIILQIYIVFV